MYSPLSYVRGPQSIPVVICQGSRSLKNKEVVYYNPDINYRGQFGLEPITGEFQVLPNEIHDSILVSGPSLSGKSYWAMAFANIYSTIFPNRDIIFITRHDGIDANVDLYPGLEKKIIVLTPKVSWLSDHFAIEEFRNSLVVFDDVESSNWSQNTDIKQSNVENNLIKQYIFDLMIDLIDNGRHYDISTIISNHEIVNGKKNSRILNSVNTIVLFPKTTGTAHINYVLSKYLGMTSLQIRSINQLNSRWVAIFRVPKIYISINYVSTY